MSENQKRFQQMLVPAGATIKEAMRAIDHSGYSTALVVDPTKRLLGLVSDGDIRRAILSGADISDSIQTMMTKQPITIRDHWTDAEVLNFLKQQKLATTGAIIKIPVVDARGRVRDLGFASPEGFSYLLRSSRSSAAYLRPVRRVLVVGGAGFIGSVLVRLLLDQGYAVSVLDSFLYGAEPLKAIQHQKRLTVFTGDTQHIEDVTNALQGADAVVHLAELVGDPACAFDPQTSQQINYLATQQLAALCRHFQINRLIYMSSCSVYGVSKNSGCVETSPLAPVSLYAKMKVGAERVLLSMQDDNFAPTILRLATVYGASPRPRFDLVVNLLTAKALIEKEIPIFGGSQWRPHVHVADVARAIVTVLEAPLAHVKGEIFNVGSNDQNQTILTIGRNIKKHVPAAALKIKKTHTDRRDYRVDFSKIRRRLGFRAAKTIDDGIKEIIQLLQSGAVKDYRHKRYSNIQTISQK